MRAVTARAVAIVAAAVAVTSAGACRAATSDAHDTPAGADRAAVAAPDHSAVDVAFLQDMISHDEQAVHLSEMVPGRTTNPAVTALARQVSVEQQEEIHGCRAQLIQWEAPLHRPNPAVTEGTVDQATVDRLETLEGIGFDRLWLQSMVAHHRGAITMAQAEIAAGRSPDIVSLAKSIVAAQQGAIDQMNQLLRS